MPVAKRFLYIRLASILGCTLIAGCSDVRSPKAAAWRAVQMERCLRAFDAREREAGQRLAEIDGRIRAGAADQESKMAKAIESARRAQRKALDEWPSRCREVAERLLEQRENDEQLLDEGILRSFR